MPSGRVKARAGPAERMVARICCEAGARVRTNVKLRDLNMTVPASDERAIEVIASGLPCYGGRQLAIDITIRSAIDRNGCAKPQAYWLDGACLAEPRVDKEEKYPEFAGSSRCELVVLAIEAGGRFSTETQEFIRKLADSKARSCPSYLRGAASAAFQRRWSRMLAATVASSYIGSLLENKTAVLAEPAVDGSTPWLQQLLTEARTR